MLTPAAIAIHPKIFSFACHRLIRFIQAHDVIMYGNTEIRTALETDKPVVRTSVRATIKTANIPAVPESVSLIQSGCQLQFLHSEFCGSAKAGQ